MESERERERETKLHKPMYRTYPDQVQRLECLAGGGGLGIVLATKN